MDGFMFLFHPQHAEVARLLASGVIGAPRQLEAWFGFPPLDAGNIRRSAGLGGGALNDAAGYTLHAARRLFGREPSVLAGRRYRSAESEVDERGVALLELGHGIVGQIAYGWGHAYRNAYTVWGAEGRLSLERAFSVPPDHAPTIVLRDRNGREERRQLVPANHFVLALSAFVAAIRGQAEREPLLDDLVVGARMLERLRDASPILVLPAEEPG
jgi:NDP-hexose-3-ketoreductase